MPTATCFADTNVAIYAIEADPAKREKALAILASHPVISTQVVNEYLNVLLAKRKLDRASANELARR
jgi:predicted nucleic acid-binding protein